MLIQQTIPYTINLVSETTMYQNEVRCTILENDFNYSQNPTVFKNRSQLTGSAAGAFYTPTGQSQSYYYIEDGTLADNITGSDFRPYATTIGLYNAANELLIIGKLATPYPIPSNTDMTFIVRWDS